MIQLINKPKLLNSKRLKKWLLDCAIRYNVEIEKLSIFFVDNKRIQQLNRKFLNHDHATDILTFPYKSTKEIEAEIENSISLPVDITSEESVKHALDIFAETPDGLVNCAGIVRFGGLLNQKVKDFVDIIQIPAFLSRQSDLITSAVDTGKTINVKKGQFMAPWDVKGIISKPKTFQQGHAFLDSQATGQVLDSWTRMDSIL